ncbi:MAG: hypothetical protein F4087_03980 [Gemmatimonadetes bacterium]|nr:hypothetical protein [Gemmatimonadota bacterium]MYJ67659.1 hypothetical protein [Gemmatimonadota bacterium]
MVVGLPDTAAGGAHQPAVGVVEEAGGGGGTTAAVGARHAVAQVLEGEGVEVLGGGGGLRRGGGRRNGRRGGEGQSGSGKSEDESASRELHGVRSWWGVGWPHGLLHDGVYPIVTINLSRWRRTPGNPDTLSGSCDDKEVQVETSSGRKILDQEAVRSARRYEYRPATVNCEPVEMWTTMQVDFRAGNVTHGSAT